MRAYACRLRSIAWMVALCAILLRAVLPAGYMPSAQHGGLTLVICTATGLKQVTLPDEKPAKPTHDAPCVFAALGALAAPDAPSLPVPVAAPAGRNSPAPVARYQAQVTAAYASRAPPVVL